MDSIKAQFVEEGGRIIGSFLKMIVTRPRKASTVVEEEPSELVPLAVPPIHRAPLALPSAPVALAVSSTISLPTSAETASELKRRLGRELYKAELDLAGGLLIAGKPCTCLESKHTLELEAAAEELIPEDPDNSVYLEIIQWISTNQYKVTVDAIHSGEYKAEYPGMAHVFKTFRKRVMNTEGFDGKSSAQLTLDQAKKLAAEEASKEVERQWKRVD